MSKHKPAGMVSPERTIGSTVSQTDRANLPERIQKGREGIDWTGMDAMVAEEYKKHAPSISKLIELGMFLDLDALQLGQMQIEEICQESPGAKFVQKEPLPLPIIHTQFPDGGGPDGMEAKVRASTRRVAEMAERVFYEALDPKCYNSIEVEPGVKKSILREKMYEHEGCDPISLTSPTEVQYKMLPLSMYFRIIGMRPTIFKEENVYRILTMAVLQCRLDGDNEYGVIKC